VEAARCAADSGDLEGAIKRAQSSLDAAVSAGLTGWAADNAVEALQVIGRQERVRDISAARSAFERAYQIATDAGSVTQRVRALVELGTIEMLDQGSGRQLAAAGELAHASGSMSAAAAIDLKLGMLWTLGTDLERARPLISRCEQNARRIGAGRVEALAIAALALASAIDGDPAGAETLARRAENVMPGNPEILFTTHGLVRVAASLSRDDVAGALSESDVAMAYADGVPEKAPRLAWALRPLLHAVARADGPAALDRARAESLAVKWNRGFFAYAEAVIAGRNGDARQATALAARAEEMLTPFAPRWNHLAHWLIAPSAFGNSWGEPVRWLREASVSFTDSAQHRLAASCQAKLRRAGQPVAPVNGSHASVPEPLRSKGITAREMDILRLVADGLSNSQIAQRLSLSRKTVESHVASLIAKTDRTGRCELVAHAARTFAT
jgi:DNA-binding CsgD family transcriptional regulator